MLRFGRAVGMAVAVGLLGMLKGSRKLLKNNKFGKYSPYLSQ